ncbi:MAG: HAMP domain-containing histidine kinase [Candidatus Pacebacteria bacterium]|nr:HAMP domain-containing histidine kinase [Candidatus Paceibacterota bacterium]
MNELFDRIGAALKKIRDNPQLIYTVAIAALIVLSFVFMANRFIGIATDAQERLVNVRIGSLQDAFVSFAIDHIQDPAYLNARIAEIVQQNETITHFRIIQKQQVFTTATTTAYIIIASNDLTEIGQADPDAEFLYSFVSGDPDHSVTTQASAGNERFFNTARAIADMQNNVVAAALTTQTLSEADKSIERTIENSIYLLVVVIVMILLLFLRHSRIIDYMDLYKRLKEVDQLKDDFISMASHELRTPLTIIRGYTESLRDDTGLSDSSISQIDKIDTSAKNLDALISDMLDVSRIEQGRMKFNISTFDPKEMIGEIVGSFDLVAKNKSLALSFKDGESAGMIAADKDHLRQILVNLIGNAVKYTKKGEVEVTRTVERGNVIIRIRDTGIGINAKDRDKLFEKFYRIRSKETEGITGTGLGLWITTELVRQMHGTISVESIEGIGSHFILSFPVVR